MQNVSLTSIPKIEFDKDGLIYQERKHFVMSRYIIIELCKLLEREKYYDIRFIAQIVVRYFSSLVAAPTSGHDFAISFTEE